MTISYQGSLVETMNTEPLEEPGRYRCVTPQATAHDIDTVLQAHRKQDEVEFGLNKTGYVYQIERKGHCLFTYIGVPQEVCQ